MARGIPCGARSGYWSSTVNGGGLLINGEEATLLRPGSAHPLETGSRHGLFEQDTRMVLDHLRHGRPLYIHTENMLHALAVAEAAERSAQTQQVVCVQDWP